LQTTPLTREQVSVLRNRRSEISNQLTSAQDRRNTAARQLQSADASGRPGIEQHLGVLDGRIVQLETELEQTGQQLRTAGYSSSIGVASGFGGGLNSADAAAVGFGFTLLVLAPISFAIARRIWRRTTRPSAQVASPENTQRIERIEHAVDAIAIEVERVSEGQRFMTKLLSESHSLPALGAEQKQPEPVPASKDQSASASDKPAWWIGT
jgi:hypothetical protein